MPDEDPAFDLPKCDEWIATHWAKCGRCMSGGMGAIPLTWSEIDAYDKCTASGLSPWEKEIIQSMSVTYCSGLQKHKDAYAIPPGWTKDQAIERMQTVSVLKLEEPA